MAAEWGPLARLVGEWAADEPFAHTDHNTLRRVA